MRVLGLEPTPFREECAAADIDTGADGSWVGGVDGLFPMDAKRVFSQLAWSDLNDVSPGMKLICYRLL